MMWSSYGECNTNAVDNEAVLENCHCWGVLKKEENFFREERSMENFPRPFFKFKKLLHVLWIGCFACGVLSSQDRVATNA